MSLSQALFVQALKSTLDKAGHDLAVAQTPDILYVDLDDVAQSSVLFAGESNAIVLGSLLLNEHPKDPLYSISFQMGARTVTDPSNYQMMDLVGQVNTLFDKGSVVPIFQFATAGSVGAQAGYFLVTDISVGDHMFEKMSGIRLLTIQGRAVRFHG